MRVLGSEVLGVKTLRVEVLRVEVLRVKVWEGEKGLEGRVVLGEKEVRKE